MARPHIHDLRWKHHFDRREKAAISGHHLPSEVELLLAMSFFRTDIAEDMIEFSMRLARSLRRHRPAGSVIRLAEVLDEVAIEPTMASILHLQDTLNGDDLIETRSRQRYLLRCRIYRSGFGDRHSILDLAQDAITLARSKAENSPLRLEYLLRGFELLTSASSESGFVHLGTGRVWPNLCTPSSKIQSPPFPVRSFLASKFTQPAASETAGDDAKEKPLDLPAAASSPPNLTDAPMSAVVLPTVGDQQTSEGKRIAKEYAAILAKRLPLLRVPRLERIREELHTRFPHATLISDRLLNELSRRRHAWIPPTILVGSPGCGKSRYAQTLLELLNLPFDLIPFGGMSDSSITGTARGYSTGRSCFAVSTILRHKVVNPAVVLDELEKVSTGRHNGHAHDALLPMLEPQTSSRYHDAYILAPVDLSHLSWLATANATSEISGPLRDRCQIIRFPPADPQFLATYIDQLLPDILASRGLGTEWQSPLSADAIAAMSEWKDGSLRTLRKMIELALDDAERAEKELPN